MNLLPFFAAAALQLPGTATLVPEADFSAAMVAGIDRFLVRETEASKGRREVFWKRDLSSPQAYETSMKPNRERLKEMLGLVDERLPVKALEFVADTETSETVVETAAVTVKRVRWEVQEGVHGEGLWIHPKGPVLARIICIPDADTPPEKLLEAALVYSLPDKSASREANRGITISAPE